MSRIDLLRFQIEELENADITVGEIDELTKENTLDEKDKSTVAEILSGTLTVTVTVSPILIVEALTPKDTFAALASILG